ncbi:hypothetical protein V493_02692 [Pseudogymnoascus sp. VKM F-4281 (FW-2241)]|nr:hypothetical protein V493_02692 [Pseudogymnoascus sp. VKM F-4281 (FW-2241)]
MKKFGFGKKKEAREADNNSGRPSANPYAQPSQSPDPYAVDTNKYANYGAKPGQEKRSNGSSSSGGASQRSQYGGLPNGPGPARNNSYAASTTSTESPPPAYGADRYGSANGYGSNRYDNTSSPYGGAPSVQSRGAGGYGGLGRSESADTTTTEDNRNALFGDAKERNAKKQSEPPANAQPGGGYEAGASSGYGTYGDRQLTAEEEESEDVEATKQEIRFMKQEDVSSTRNALRMASQAEETGRGTLARLGAQGERIHNTEKNLDLAANHNRIAEERTRELKTLNKSMFAVHVANPFTSSSRKAARDQNILDKHHDERDQREATRQAAFSSGQRMNGAFKELQPGDRGYKGQAAPKASLADRAKYQFEADSEDDMMEDEIEGNLGELHGAAQRLNLLAQATGKELDEQDDLIRRVGVKGDRVDDQIAMNRAKLERIR